ncbi:MAG: hypothetical protein IJ308_01865 [Clostridia bacterium]|nr:hypothetical protein [Clostridia bacterium]
MKKIVTSLCLVFALGATVASGALIAKAINSENTVIELPESGLIGECYDIPEFFAEINGESVRADVRILAPDGNVYVGTQLKPTMAGQYIVEYTLNGEVVKTETCIIQRRATDFFSVNKFAQVQGITQYRYLDDPYFKGVKVNVQTGAEITFEREIDMTNKSKNDIFFEAIIEPSKHLEIDYGQLILTFTDVEDDTKTMTVVASDGHLDSLTSGGVAYVRAGCNGQSIGGREKRANGSFVFNTTDIYGSIAPFSFRAQTFEGETRYDYSLGLSYDSEEKALYLKNGINDAYGQRFMIADFDDPTIFGGAVWDGFTSGKVKLTVTFDKVQKESGSIIFKQIDGIDLGQQYLVDDVAPELSVDLNGERTAPNSALGNTYTVFNAVARDFYDAEVPVLAEVKYENLSTGNSYDVFVENGKFITDKVGKYTITYTATDLSGNSAYETVSFYCYGQSDEIIIENVDEEQTVSVFEAVTIVGASGVKATGGNGNLHVGCMVYTPDGQEVTLQNNTFTPDMIGDYKIVYTAKDYFGVEEKQERLIHVTAIDRAVFLTEPSLPEVLISGFHYVLPESVAKTCEGNNVTDAVVETYVNDEKVAGSFVAPKSGSVKVEYRAYLSGNTGSYEPITKTIAIVNGNDGKEQAAYFYDGTEKVSAEVVENGVKLKFSESSGVSFANKLNGDLFEFTASYDATKVNFSKMRVVLFDAEKSDVSVTFRLAFSANGVNIGLPGTEMSVLASKGTTFALKYNNDQCVLKDINNGVNNFVRLDDKGNAFTGFSGAVFMKVYFDDVSGDSEMTVQSLNSQAFGIKKTKDDVDPQIAINGTYLYKRKVGDMLTVYSANAYDVLNEVVDFTVSVTAPDGSILLNKVSPNQEYKVALNQRGIYKIVYTAKDAVGNDVRGGSTIEAGDVSKPTLTVNGNVAKSYEVGDTVKLPNVTVTDDTGTAYCDIFVELPTGEVRLLVHYENAQKISYLSKLDEHYPHSFKVSENAFRAETAGNYVIRIMAYDAAYNYVLQEYAFTVVK